MTAELLEEQQPQGTLEPISERTVARGAYTTIEMQVDWEDYENFRIEKYVDADAAAFFAVRRQLSKTGHGNSAFTLLKNETLVDKCDAETGWETVLSGKALFQVTLLRDSDSQESGTFFFQPGRCPGSPRERFPGPYKTQSGR